MIVNIDALCPWDLTLTVGGKNYATACPQWVAVIELEELQHYLAAIQADPAMTREDRLAAASRIAQVLGRFFGEELPASIAELNFDGLLAVMSTCHSYLEAYLKKKVATAKAAAISSETPLDPTTPSTPGAS